MWRHPGAMRRSSRILAVGAALALALAPALAEARPGDGRSLGSRGSRSFEAPPATRTAPQPARPLERTQQQPGQQPGYGSAPQQAQRPPIGQPNPQGGFFARHPFTAGLMGGLLGAGLFGLLSGHGLFGGFTGLGSMLGLLLQVGLIVLLAMLALRLFRSRQQPAMAGVPNGLQRQMQGGPQPVHAGGGGARPSAGINVTPTDFQAFEQTLKAVNEAWSRSDAATLQRLCTPEMAQYFNEDMQALAARGLKNETRDVVLEQGDLSEAWAEGAREYATVAMRFSLRDITYRLADNQVVEGDPNRRVEATELWTFVRPQGGQWQLSAVQQTG